jgi:uncharacterized protein YhbP (UPF0306 family)
MSPADFSIEQEVRVFLAVCRTATLATVDDEGLPHAANVQYACDDAWSLVWISSEKSAHSQHLVHRLRAAVTVYAHQDSPAEIRGVQMHGIVTIERDEQRDVALHLYRSKFPFVIEEPYRTAMSKQTLYRFTPSWLRYIDNRRGFGWKVELDLSAGRATGGQG